MIRKYGDGIAPCIDTAYENIASAGLKAWYDGNPSAAAPLLTSVTMKNANEFLALSKNYKFKFVAKLFDTDDRHCVDVLSTQAAEIFYRAANRYGFAPQDIFFDLDCAPMIKDIPEADKRSVTYAAFETIKRIKADKKLEHVNCIMRPSLAAMKMPRSVGMLRAYIEKAMQYGLDAAFVDMQRGFGLVPADEKLMELVALFAKIDGSSHTIESARSALDKFCEKNAKKPKAKPKA
jgi:cobalamin-dependent methionine synthase I